MRLTVLGCSGSGPGPFSPASGYLVTAGDARLTLDLGNGTFGALQRHLDPWQLDAVAFSHLHPDHCADFTALVVYRRYHPHAPFDPRRARCRCSPRPRRPTGSPGPTRRRRPSWPRPT